jgi:DNA gyrase/topoisomerase IV subunit A
MPVERPDLSQVSPEIRSYIEELEAELRRYIFQKEVRGTVKAFGTQRLSPSEPEPVETESIGVSEPQNSLNLVTLSALRMIKRTPRHLYLCQRRGGMGIFDLETRAEDQPALITIADDNQSLLIFTNLARVFRWPMAKLGESPVRSRGESLAERLSFEPDERPVSILPAQASGLVALVSQTGLVRCLRHHLFGEYLKQGTALFNTREFGLLASGA